MVLSTHLAHIGSALAFPNCRGVRGKKGEKMDPNANVQYLTATIAEVRLTAIPRYGICRDGYTIRSGAPTSMMIRLVGERRWRRVMFWQYSNSGTLFVRIARRPYVVIPSQIPEK